MKYELAKELKEAGFPMTPYQGGLLCVNGKTVMGFDDGTYYLLPSLSELIEACGEEFWNLTYDGGEWHTNFTQGSEYDFGETEGKTPEEAVARLWLALNKV